MTKSETTSSRDQVDLEIIARGTGGSRARTKRVARLGIGQLRQNQELSQKRKDASQYRACRALLWDRDRILLETRWSLQWFMSIEKFVHDEDRRIWSETDARNLFASYRDQQLQIALELEDLSEIFRGSKQYNALVASLRTRADVLDRIVKTGQELGVIHKTAKQVEVTGAVDITTLSVVELRAHVQSQVSEIRELLVPVDAPKNVAGTVLKRLAASFTGGESGESKEVKASQDQPPAARGPRTKRVKKLARKTPSSTLTEEASSPA